MSKTQMMFLITRKMAAKLSKIHGQKGATGLSESTYSRPELSDDKECCFVEVYRIAGRAYYVYYKLCIIN